MAEATEIYRAARDQLLGLRGHQAVAASDTCRWPNLADRFNWAVDWFDAVARGSDRPALIVMLNNQVELWETMLAVMKLGAIIMATTTAAGATEIVNRLNRGGARHAIGNAADADLADRGQPARGEFRDDTLRGQA